jgi:hypothetical protein
MINKQNYEEYLIDYLHGELSGNLKHEMELMLEKDMEIKDAFEWLKQTILEVDDTIVFEQKELLYKKSTTHFFIHYKRMVAAAALVIGVMLSLVLIMQRKNYIPPDDVNYVKQAAPKKEVKQPLDIRPDTSMRSSTSVVSQHKSSAGFNQSPAQRKEYKEALPSTKETVEVQDNIVKQDQAPLNKTEPNLIENSSPVITTSIPPETIAKANDVIQSEQQKVEIPEASDIPSKNTFILSERKQPGLFSALAQLSRLLQKVKHTKDQLTHTEITVMIGNKKIINLN